jgi:hypothetical protein
MSFEISVDISKLPILLSVYEEKKPLSTGWTVGVPSPDMVIFPTALTDRL